MKVKDLIELNAMITDLEITVRKDGNLLLDQLNIGPSEGVVPPYPTRVPKEERFAGSLAQHTDKYKDAAYIPKSINAWDDGKDYYEIKVNRIPAKWLELEVHSWEVWKASSVGTTSPRRYHNNFQGSAYADRGTPERREVGDYTTKRPKREGSGTSGTDEH